MADSRVSVAGPVSIQSDSKERVAYDLMGRILNNEASQPKTRYSLLELYSQCHQAVMGAEIHHITPEVKRS
jgi:hypothetical protein